MFDHPMPRNHTFICVDCGASFDSNAVRPQRCPPCRKVRRKFTSDRYYHSHKVLSVKQHGKQRVVRDDRRGYEDDEKRSGVYSSLAAIRLDSSVGRCRGCAGNKPLINGYCDTCRSFGANEAQCMRPQDIAAKRG